MTSIAWVLAVIFGVTTITLLLAVRGLRKDNQKLKASEFMRTQKKNEIIEAYDADKENVIKELNEKINSYVSKISEIESTLEETITNTTKLKEKTIALLDENEKLIDTNLSLQINALYYKTKSELNVLSAKDIILVAESKGLKVKKTSTKLELLQDELILQIALVELTKDELSRICKKYDSISKISGKNKMQIAAELAKAIKTI